jgi:hypothetical protein
MTHREPTISRLIRVIGAGLEPFGALAILPWNRLIDVPSTTPPAAPHARRRHAARPARTVPAIDQPAEG